MRAVRYCGLGGVDPSGTAVQGCAATGESTVTSRKRQGTGLRTGARRTRGGRRPPRARRPAARGGAQAVRARHRAGARLPGFAQAGRAAGRDPAAEEPGGDARNPSKPKSDRRPRGPHPQMSDSVTERLAGWQRRVESELDRWLPPESVLPQRLHAAQRYSVLGPGKRIRPALVYATAETLGVPAGARRCRGLRRRADPRLLAGARRPAGHGRRRPAPRPADLPPRLRRGDGDPRRRLAAGAGVQDPRRPPGRSGGRRRRASA